LLIQTPIGIGTDIKLIRVDEGVGHVGGVLVEILEFRGGS